MILWHIYCFPDHMHITRVRHLRDASAAVWIDSEGHETGFGDWRDLAVVARASAAMLAYGAPVLLPVARGTAVALAGSGGSVLAACWLSSVPDAAISALLEAGPAVYGIPSLGATRGAGPDAPVGVLVRSPRMVDVVSTALDLAQTELRVLLLGAVGVGKSFIARLIHERGPRRAKPFVALDCGTLTETLGTSELFGYRKGAFTGASADSPGIVGRAKGGVLFLDEVGNLSMEQQKLLLGWLSSKQGEYWPVGGERPEYSNARLICATNEDLLALVEAGRFRYDLYSRIEEYSLVVPSLGERMEDIQPLTEHFVRLHHKAVGLSTAPPIAWDAWPALLAKAPALRANVRELETLCKRAMFEMRRSGATCLDARHFGLASPAYPTLDAITHEFRVALARLALDRHQGDYDRAAQEIGCHRSTLYKLVPKGAG